MGALDGRDPQLLEDKRRVRVGLTRPAKQGNTNGDYEYGNCWNQARLLYIKEKYARPHEKEMESRDSRKSTLSKEF